MNINENRASSASQKKEILNWLQSGHTLTQLEALSRFRCFRLASRISELRLEDNVPIESRYIIVNTGKRVKEYFIEK